MGGSRFSVPGRGRDLFLFTTASRPALGAHPASYPVVTEDKADHSLPSNANVMNAWS